MKILFVASEAAPFIKTGGLADVAGSLPKAIKEQGHDIRLVLPLHSKIKEEFREKMEYIGYFYQYVAGNDQYCGVFQLEHDGVTTYFLDNEKYFKRENLYGEFDDCERYIFFSKACVGLLRFLDFQADVVHANDWHSGLVPVYVNDIRYYDEFYKDVKTLYTIHNIGYQGIFSGEEFWRTGLDVGYMKYTDLEFNGNMSFMKAGIVHATKFNTVSETYAQEIRSEFYGRGLEEVINHYAYKLSGIVNGIDYEIYNPVTDNHIFKNYDKKNLNDKRRNKMKLQEKYGLPVRKDVVLIGMVSRLDEMKGIELINHILDELLQEDIQIVFLGTGNPDYEGVLKHFEYTYPDKVASRMYFSASEANLIYAASDLYLMPSITEPCGISQLIAMRYGAVPIVRETGGLVDTVQPYNQYTGEGTGFSFRNINAHELLFKIKEAVELFYSNKRRFNKILRNGMKTNFNWDRSSKNYIDLYRSL